MLPPHLVFNGINGASGDYLLPPMTPQEITAFVRGGGPDDLHRKELKLRHLRDTENQFPPYRRRRSQRPKPDRLGCHLCPQRQPADPRGS
jgi:hypothetical protein